MVGPKREAPWLALLSFLGYGDAHAEVGNDGLLITTGHGGRTPDLDGDEDDGKPWEFNWVYRRIDVDEDRFWWCHISCGFPRCGPHCWWWHARYHVRWSDRCLELWPLTIEEGSALYCRVFDLQLCLMRAIPERHWTFLSFIRHRFDSLLANHFFPLSRTDSAKGCVERTKSGQGGSPRPDLRPSVVREGWYRRHGNDCHWIFQESCDWDLCPRAVHDNQDLSCGCGYVLWFQGHADIVGHPSLSYSETLSDDAFDRADTFQAGEARGALTWAFINALKKYPQQSYLQLLNSLRGELHGRYTQKPQLSCSHPLGIHISVLRKTSCCWLDG